METNGYGDSLGCPLISQANQFCNVLVNEVAHADTWASIEDAINAIQRVRSRERWMVSEWERVNNPSPQSACANIQTHTPHERL